jgi:hypothetical protein
VQLSGIHADVVYGLSITDNHLLNNGSFNQDAGSSGVALMNAFGEVMVHDNELVANPIFELVIMNDDDTNDLPADLFDVINWYATGNPEIPIVDPQRLRSMISVQDNHLDAPCLTCLISTLEDLMLTNNLIRMQIQGTAQIWGIRRSVVANNRIRVANGAALMLGTDDATVLGNITKPAYIVAFLPNNTDFEHGLNIPEVLINPF